MASTQPDDSGPAVDTFFVRCRLAGCAASAALAAADAAASGVAREPSRMTIARRVRNRALWMGFSFAASWPATALADVRDDPPIAAMGDAPTSPPSIAAVGSREATSAARPATHPPQTEPSASDLDAARHDYQFQLGVPCPYCGATPALPSGRNGLHWHDHWRSVDWPEYVLTPLLGVVSAGVSLLPPARSARWDSPILFDGGARNLLRLHSASARKTAEDVSDVLFYWEVAHPLILDPLIVTWGLRQAPAVAWQMSVINVQAYALTLVLNQATKRLSARKRPYVDACDRDPTGASCASGGRYGSFYSGHAAVTATGAGLICAHHTQLSLYQDPALDTGTCVAAVLGTAVTGAMRIAADNHWASDVLVGHLMGYLSGYLLPTLLYYKEFRSSPPKETPSDQPVVAALPIIDDHSLQLELLGAF